MLLHHRLNGKVIQYYLLVGWRLGQGSACTHRLVQLLLILAVLLVVLLHLHVIHCLQRPHGKLQRSALVRPGFTNYRHIDNGLLYPVRHHQYLYAVTNGRCRHRNQA